MTSPPQRTRQQRLWELQLEHIAWALRRLSHEEQRCFRAFAERTAASDRDPDIAARIRQLVPALLAAEYLRRGTFPRVPRSD
jgi:hypothetical protein